MGASVNLKLRKSSQKTLNANVTVQGVELKRKPDGDKRVVKKAKAIEGGTLAIDEESSLLDVFREGKEHRLGTVCVHGSGECGELGLGDEVTSRKKPTPLEALHDKQICRLAVGGLHNLALSASGKIYSWGCNDQKALGRDGEETVPHLVQHLEDIPIVQVAAGDSISLALTRTGKVYAWGTFRDSTGIMGFNDLVEIQETPVLIKELEKEQVIKIASGANHVLVLTKNHEVWTWGSGEQGQLGRRILSRHKSHGLTPRPLVLGKRRGSSGHIKNIFSGAYHAFAIDSKDRVFSWGLNNYGQLGVGDRENRCEPQLLQQEGGSLSFHQLDGGEHHSLALSREGQVYSFGRGNYGQLGHQSEDDYLVPRSLEALSEKRILKIACGDHHSLALSDSGELYAWGYGEMLQLGNGMEADEHVPHRVESKYLENKTLLEIHGGAQHTVLLVASI